MDHYGVSACLQGQREQKPFIIRKNKGLSPALQLGGALKFCCAWMSYPPAEELHGCEIKGKTKPIPKFELNDNCMAFFLQTYIVTHSLANAADRLQCHPSHSTQKL